METLNLKMKMKTVGEIILWIVIVFAISGFGAFWWTAAKENKYRSKILDNINQKKLPLHKPCCDAMQVNQTCGCKSYTPIEQMAAN